MSWNTSVPATPKAEFAAAVDAAATSPPGLAAEPHKQHKAVKAAAKKLAQSAFPHATKLTLSANGHACTEGTGGTDSVYISMSGS